MGGGGGIIELLSPISGKKSPVDVYLQKIGNTPYHICYKVSDINKSVASLQDKGFTLISIPAPSEPLRGLVCFLYAPEVGIIELIQREND